MTFRVKFSEQGGSFRARFGETHNTSDGGYERGYAEGLADGQNVWKYVRSIAGIFQYSAFPEGTDLVLDVPTLSLVANAGSLNYICRSTTGLERLTMKCTARGVPVNAHSAFSRCSDLKFLDLSEFNTTFGSSTDVFYSCGKLEEIRGEIENTTTTWNLWFTSCGNLREVRFKPNSIKGAFNISNSPLLSAESVQSIVDGLADLTGSTSSKATLHADVKARLTEEQLAQIAAKNWTVG